MPLFEQVVLTTAYLPPAEYFFAIARSGKVLIEQHEIYQKQSYRTRCRIYSTHGAETLSIPVLRNETHKIPIREVRIDWSDPWLLKHKRALEAAYNHSAFFEYYKDDLFAILDKRHEFLFDLNLELLQALLKMAGIRADIELTQEYIPNYGKGDFRERIQPKYKGENLLKEYKKEKAWYQVFSNDASQGSFIPNLSVVDLLCAEGPNAISFL